MISDDEDEEEEDGMYPWLRRFWFIKLKNSVRN